MKRREFIRLGGFLTVSAAAMGMTGCDIVGDSEDTSASALSPNDYPTPSRPMPAVAAGADWQFPQSIASGDPKPDSIILWARVLPIGAAVTDAASADVAIRLKVTSADNASSLGSDTALVGNASAPAFEADLDVPAYVDYDGTVRHKLTGLANDTLYYYQFTAGTVRSKVGRFKTAPAATASRDVKFAFMTCQDWSYNHWGVFEQLVADDVASPADLDFVVHLGDYIYETNNGGLAAQEALHAAGITFPAGTTFAGGEYATEKADYRYLYKLYRSDARIQAMHERFPMVAVWDDHEFSDDSWSSFETYDNKNIAQTERRRNANQAWFEYMPADVTFQETNPSFLNIQLYRDLQFGQMVHLIMTDERLYKQDHLIPESTVLNGVELGRINTRYLAPEATLKYVETVKNAASANLGLISILGATQRAWWKDKMLNSTATWKFWGNEVSLLRMSLNGTDALGTLIALGSVSTLAGNIGSAAALFSGSMNKAACYVGAVTFGAAAYPSSTATITAVNAMETAFNTAVGGGLNPASATDQPTIIGSMVVAGMTNGLSQRQATVGAIAFFGSLSATAGGASAQAAKAAQAICIGSSSSYFSAADTLDTVPCIRNDIRTNKTSSPYFLAAMASADAASSLPAGTSAAKVTPFFQKFVINADQWDGYRKERTELMNFLLGDNSLSKVVDNVVAITGDLHAFFAGTVYNEFKGEVQTYTMVGSSAIETGAATANGSAAMVDFVTAGVSSTSWFSYLAAAAAGLDPTNALIGKLVYYKLDVSALFGETANTTFVNLNLLDYTMGKAAPADAAALAQQLAPQLKVLAVQKLGATDGTVDATAAGLQAALAGSSTFAQLVGLAQMLAALGAATNPWIAAGHVDTNAQGYSLVTATAAGVEVKFRKVNPLVGAVAPSAGRLLVSETTMHVAVDTTTVVQGALP